MATVTKSVLKTYFEQGDIPTQGQYVDLIDSQLNLGEVGTQVIQGNISASAAEIESITMKKLYLQGNGIASMKVGTTFNIGKTLEVSGSFNVTRGNISITSSGQFQGENATITNISGSYISASGHIYSAGNISASGTSTGSFGSVEVSSRIEHAQDPNTGIRFSGDVVSIFANNIQGAKFASTKTNIGNTLFPTSITGSSIKFLGPVTGTGTATFNSATFSQGINISTITNAYTSSWNDSGTISSIEYKNFTVLINDLPEFEADKHYHGRNMTINNPLITSSSIVLVTHQYGALGDILLKLHSVSNGGVQIKPYCTNSEGASSGQSAAYNFAIL